MWSIIIYFLILFILSSWFVIIHLSFAKRNRKNNFNLLKFSFNEWSEIQLFVMQLSYRSVSPHRLTTFGVEWYYSSYQILDSMFMIPSPIEIDSLTPDRYYHRPPGQQWWSVDPDHRGTLNTRQRGTRSSFSGGVGLRQASANDLPETAQESRW